MFWEEKDRKAGCWWDHWELLASHSLLGGEHLDLRTVLKDQFWERLVTCDRAVGDAGSGGMYRLGQQMGEVFH